jgi:hypothetical protein
MGQFINIIGKTFNRLTVISRNGTQNGHVTWKVKCICGKEKIVKGIHLKNGYTKSCGCYNAEIAKNHIKHGYARRSSKIPEYKIWLGMKERCYNKNSLSFYRYGGRKPNPIYVCDKWLHSFENFLKDMGFRPSKNYSIDRINNEGPYSPENCRWATDAEQRNNKSNNHFIFWKKQKLTIKQICDLENKNPKLIRERIKRGLSIKEALFNKKYYDRK